MSSALVDELRAAIVPALPPCGVVAIGVVMPGEPVGTVSVFSGSSPINTAGTTIHPDASTPFEIASVTKTFTPFVYFESGRDFRATFGSLFPAYPNLNASVANIPVIALANFQSGFPADNEGEDWPPTTELSDPVTLFNWMSSCDFRKEHLSRPLSCYTYSNFAFGLLGLACANATDDPADGFDRQVRAWCSLLGMPDTFLYPGSDFDTDLPIGSRMDGNWQPLNANYDPVAPMNFGCGGIVSTGADMLQWLQYNMGRIGGGEVPPPYLALQGEVFSGPSCGEAGGPLTSTLCGWFLDKKRFAPGLWVWKNGRVSSGFTSYIAFSQWVKGVKVSDTGVFVLTNIVGEDENWAQDVGHLVLWMLTGRNGPPPMLGIIGLGRPLPPHTPGGS